ncbi:MAG: superoxide dismutase [Microgenomates group bacterium]
MFSLPDLPYAYEALEPSIDKETMTIHHDKHHATYVKNLNDVLVGYEDIAKKSIEEILSDLDHVPEEIMTKVRNNGGGHFNHSLFWEIMGKGELKAPANNLADAINSKFGSFSAFQEKFTAAALGRFGSGWIWLIASKEGLDIVDTPNQDSPVMDGKNPILGLDIWEHAYYLKYKNVRADYISNWWNVVLWTKVEENFLKAVGGEKK